MAGRHRSHEAALARSRYLGEAAITARYVVGTNTGPVIDECSPAQQSVRALLALLALNAMRPGSGLFANTAVSDLVCYTLTLSPRRNTLMIVNNAPDNVAHRLLDCGFRFAGEAEPKHRNDIHRVYRLEHFASGAEVYSTSDPGTLRGVQCAVREGLPVFTRQTVGVAPTAQEQAASDYVESLDADSRALLAALFVRLNARGGRVWAVGQFYWDPLKRPPAPWWDQDPLREGRRSLTETGTGWQLRWTGPPFPGDVVAALTDPVCGLPGAHAVGQAADREREIAYGATHLLLRPF